MSQPNGEDSRPPQPRGKINDPGEIPAFESEHDEAVFWQTHTLGPGMLARMKPYHTAPGEGLPWLPEPGATDEAAILRRIKRAAFWNGFFGFFWPPLLKHGRHIFDPRRDR